MANRATGETDSNNSDIGGFGGGMFISGGGASIELIDTWFVDNDAEGDGGGAHVEGENYNIDVLATNFLRNVAGGSQQAAGQSQAHQGSGGGLNIDIDESEIHIGSRDVGNMPVNSVFSSNTAHGVGLIDSINESVHSPNGANGAFTPRHLGGGGLFINGTDNEIVLDGIQANANETTYPGTADEVLVINQVNVPTEFSNGDGGGLAVASFTSRDHSSRVAIHAKNIEAWENVASGEGGGVYLLSSDSEQDLDGADVIVEDSQFYENLAIDGGGLYGFVSTNNAVENTANEYSLFEIINSSFTNNTATNHGGGAFLCTKYSGRLDVANSTFSNNTAGEQGGGLAIGVADGSELGSIGLTNLTITENVADEGTGLAISPDGFGAAGDELKGDIDVVMVNSIVAGNEIDGQTDPISGDQAIGNDVFVGELATPPNHFNINSRYNLLGVVFETGCGFSLSCKAGLTDTTNQFLQSLNSTLNGNDQLDPLLGPLGDYGGKTLTHLPEEGFDGTANSRSHAIDLGGGDNQTRWASEVGRLPFDSDQRGENFTRTLGFNEINSNVRLDIGATELSYFLKVVDIEILSYREGMSYDVVTGTSDQLRTVALGATANGFRVTFNRPVSIINNGSQIELDFLQDSSQNHALENLTANYDCKRIFLHGTDDSCSSAVEAYGVEFSLHTDNLFGGQLTTQGNVTFDPSTIGNYAIIANNVSYEARALDGEWVGPTSIHNCPSAGCQHMPSGNDSAGGEFKFEFVILPVDFDHNNDVQLGDFLIQSKYFESALVEYFVEIDAPAVFGDLHLDGVTGFDDFLGLSTLFGQNFIDSLL